MCRGGILAFADLDVEQLMVGTVEARQDAQDKREFPIGSPNFAEIACD
jgi:hypothetical protein